MREAAHDVLIVGSGPTGGYAAKRLTEAGLRVLVLDAGPSSARTQLRHALDRARRRLGYRIEEDPRAVRRQRVQSGCYAWPEHPHAFVDDIEAPYTTPPDKPFAWIRSWHRGGRMVVKQHGLQFYRFSDLDFRSGERDGASDCWPLSYRDLVPYYEHVERWMRIFGTRAGLAQLPDSILAGERGLNDGEQALAAGLSRHVPGPALIPGRTAAPVIPIRDALATGRCRVRPNALVHRLLLDGSGSRVRGIEFVDRRTRATHGVSADVVVLCASAIESARILLASATSRAPDGLANNSGVVGRYLMDHTHMMGFHANMPLSQPVRTSSWAHIPRFRNIASMDPRFARGYGIQVFTMWRECALTVFGEMLPRYENRVTLDRDRTDEYDRPLAHIECTHSQNERAMAEDAAATCMEVLEAANFEITRSNTRFSAPGLAAHETGTVRMGADPRTSALNSFCQSWDVKNLFVMDGSCFVTQATQNPTLTMLALAARSCDYLLDLRRRGELR